MVIQMSKYIKGIIIGLSLIGFMLTNSPVIEAAGQKKFVMSYIYFGQPDKYIDAVNQTKGSLDMVSPSYFDVNTDGSLQLTDSLDENFVAAMHAQGIKVVPFLSNHWDRNVGIAAMNNKEALVKQIARAIETYNLDGVNVDIENITEKQRDAFTKFVQMLRAAIPAHKEVSVAVAANPEGWDAGWYGAFDYAALGKASDYLMLMTYDESYEGGDPGPVASLPFVEKSIQEALKVVPSNKLVVGIPFYGRYWKSDGTMKGLGIQNTVVEQLVQRYGGKTVYDEASQAPRASFVIPAGNPGTSVHGIKLTSGSYTVWYENDRSIQAKLSLVQKYNLKGAGNWSLNEEADSTWDYYTAWINNAAYRDIIGHWAESSIEYVTDKGWMTSMTSNLFQPNSSLTRAQAAAVLVRMTGAALDPGAPTSLYWDVPKNHWAAADIRIAKQKGFIGGRADGSFGPNQPVTREELAAMLSRVLKLPQSSANTLEFSDVDSDRWSAEAIQSLTDYGIVHGYKDGTFRPRQPVTRAEMAAMLQSVDNLK